MRSRPGCSRAATRPEPPWSRPRYKALRQFIERPNHRRLVRKVLLISMVLLYGSILHLLLQGSTNFAINDAISETQNKENEYKVTTPAAQDACIPRAPRLHFFVAVMTNEEYSARMVNG